MVVCIKGSLVYRVMRLVDCAGDVVLVVTGVLGLVIVPLLTFSDAEVLRVKKIVDLAL